MTYVICRQTLNQQLCKYIKALPNQNLPLLISIAKIKVKNKALCFDTTGGKIISVMNITQAYLQTWAEARTRFSNLLPALKEEELTKKLSNTKNSAGFLIRHIGDVELLFAKNVFGASETAVNAKTLITGYDTGEWTNLPELLAYQQYALNALKTIIEKQTDKDWMQLIKTQEFGTKTKAEALGRIISHTAYHAGQLALTLKYS